LLKEGVFNFGISIWVIYRPHTSWNPMLKVQNGGYVYNAFCSVYPCECECDQVLRLEFWWSLNKNPAVQKYILNAILGVRSYIYDKLFCIGTDLGIFEQVSIGFDCSEYPHSNVCWLSKLATEVFQQKIKNSKNIDNYFKRRLFVWMSKQKYQSSYNDWPNS